MHGKVHPLLRRLGHCLGRALLGKAGLRLCDLGRLDGLGLGSRRRHVAAVDGHVDPLTQTQFARTSVNSMGPFGT